MATKRIKSFSPYSYSIQYAKAGEGPVQKPHPYVNMAILPEEHFVIAKKDPNWYSYMINTAIFSINDECEPVFDKVTSEISIIHKTVKLEENYKLDVMEISENLTLTFVCDLLKVDIPTSIWTSNNTVEINHYLDSDVDCIVLANSEFIKVSKKFNNSNKLTLYFEDNFDKRNYTTIKCIIYGINTENYPLVELDNNQVSYDKINNVVSINNLYMTNKCVAMLFDNDDKSYVFENIDLTPNRILFDASNIEILEKSEILSEISSIDNRMQEIMDANPMTPSAYLLGANEEFRHLANDKNLLEMKLNKIRSDDRYVDVKKAMVYISNNGTFQKSIKYGINDNETTWNGNIVEITHNIKGYVNVILDDTLHSETSYKIFEVSENKIKIVFNNPRYAICNVRIFKIGDR